MATRQAYGINLIYDTRYQERSPQISPSPSESELQSGRLETSMLRTITFGDKTVEHLLETSTRDLDPQDRLVHPRQLLRHFPEAGPQE